MTSRVGVFGWGIVAPRSPNVERFRQNLECAEHWLTPFDGFGPANFMVGHPEFDFGEYREWIGARFPPRRFAQLEEKMDLPSLYAVGAFIQSLAQNPGVEAELTRLGTAAHVYVGTGLGNVGKAYEASIALDRAQRRWERFWADPSRNAALRGYLASGTLDDSPAPERGDEGDDQRDQWNRFWAERSPELTEYLRELAAIEGVSVSGAVETAKLRTLRARESQRLELQRKWGAPDPPWLVSADVIWNIHNTPAAQVSMIGSITGLAFAPVAACSTFGVALRLAMAAIRSGDAKAVVVGATDPPPHPLIVGAFYSARVLSADGRASLPLTRFQGTHISGGAVVWILGDYEHMTGLGFRPLGMEPMAVGVSSDAHHIITPTTDGPQAAIRQALGLADAQAGEIGTWDLHATATPGDYNEVQLLQGLVPPSVLCTARKGMFGHGMSAGSGWELTAQYMGYEAGRLFPTPMERSDLNPEIAALRDAFVLRSGDEFPAGIAGKLSIGIGGINACVLSRPFASGSN
jgi:3-oxoacyl-[acyl-carrier-protein] synthase II